MRIAHVIHDTSLGGVEVATAHLRAALPARGVRYRVLAFAEARSGHRALRADARGRGLNSPMSVAALLAALRREQPDVLITSLWRAVALGLVRRALPQPPAWAVYLHASRWTQPIDRLTHRLALPRADLIVCDSAATRDALVPRRLHARTRVVLPAGAPLTPPAGIRRADPRTGPIRLLWAGRLSAEKAPERAITLLAVLRSLHPDRFRLTVVGPDAGVGEDVRSAAREAGVEALVDFTGPLERGELAGLAAASHFFVQTSDFEGLGMALGEAIALGCVPVTTPVGEVAQRTVDGVDAIHFGTRTAGRVGRQGALAVVSFADLTAAAERLAALSADPAALERMARTGAAPAVDFPSQLVDALAELGAEGSS